MTIASDIQKLDVGREVKLFEIDTTAFAGGSINRFHDGSNEFNGDVIWDGNVYQKWPIQASGFELTGEGTLARPRIKVSNVLGTFYNLNLQFQDLVGAVVTRISTFIKYLDAANFTNGNPNADPAQKLPDEIWSIHRKTSENKIFVEYELAAPWDVEGVILPRRKIIKNICVWLYRSPECSYVGPAVAKRDDTPTGILAEDDCGKRVASCKLRFGDFNELPFGGFPGANLVK